MTMPNYQSRRSIVATLVLLSMMGRIQHVGADVIVLSELEGTPRRHHVGVEDGVTEVSDLWYASTMPDFPSLTNEEGNLIFRIRTPGETRLVTDDREGLTEFWVGLGWYGPPANNGAHVGKLELSPTVEFYDEVGTPPYPYSPAYTNFGVTEDVGPFELAFVQAELSYNGVQQGWGFSGFDISVPIDDIVSYIPTTQSLSPGHFGHFNLTYEMELSGDQRGTAKASEFTRLVPICDFNGDGLCDGSDIDRLMNDAANGGTATDLNGDGAVNNMDRDEWLDLAGRTNGFAEPVPVGDSNLDGTVDVTDLNALALSYTDTQQFNWTGGNFNVDGGLGVNAADLNTLAQNWNASSAHASTTESVPEPNGAGVILLSAGMLFFVFRRTKFRRPEIQGPSGFSVGTNKTKTQGSCVRVRCTDISQGRRA